MSTTKTLDLGDELPAITLNDENGKAVALNELRGRRIVLYFYPKDDTPGCTTQACSLRDEWSAFESVDDVVVFGVSPNDEASHTKFRKKHELPFSLLVDSEHKLADLFGFWVEKSMYGRKYWGMERSTVIIDADGFVSALKRKVKPGEHTSWLRKQLDL